MGGASDTDMRDKPDLSQPVNITGLNQTIALIDLKSQKALRNARSFTKMALGVGAISAGMFIFGGIPLIAAGVAAAVGGAAVHENTRGQTLTEIRRHVSRNKEYYGDEKPDLSNPVKISGMNKAVAMLNKRSGKAFKKSKKWLKVAAVAGGLAGAMFVLNMAPVITTGLAVVSLAVAGYNYTKGRAYTGIRDEFNASSGAARDARLKQEAAPAKPKPMRKTAQKSTAPPVKKDDGKKPWKPVPGIYGQRR